MTLQSLVFPSLRLAVVACVGLFMASGASAALRCDCSRIVEACSAEVSFADAELEIQSSSDACSRVDYLIEGQPYAALVVDGEAEFDWDGQPQSEPVIVVENCRVCADAKLGNAESVAEGAAAATAGSDAAADAADDELRALVKVMPNYPRAAFGRGIEGRVTVEFSLADDGVVENIRLVDSTNAMFVTSTLDAVSRFRYSGGSSDPIQEEFSFRLLNGSDPVVSSRTL